jgi:hypothetical protein
MDMAQVFRSGGTFVVKKKTPRLFVIPNIEIVDPAGKKRCLGIK